MPIKVYLSEANQAGNVGADGTTEKQFMVPIVNALYTLLDRDPRFAPYHCTYSGRDTASENVAEANRLGVDRYVALHSNAGGTGARGTICFYHSGSVKGKALATALYAAIAPLSPGTSDHGIAPHDGFIEIGGPDAPAALLEIEAHDWRTGCEFLHRYAVIARALYKGVCRGCGFEPSVEVLDPKVTVRVELRKSQLPGLRAYVANHGGEVSGG
jgi:hypothetical protein